MRITDNYVFFWKDWPSNYQKTKIWPNQDEAPLMYFTSTEQAFMYDKAIYFHDYETADLILNEDNPDKCRKLGRTVKGYNDKEWDEVRYDVVDSYEKLIELVTS